jgi:protein involved in polysaccharide export with SLBB domain
MACSAFALTGCIHEFKSSPNADLVFKKYEPHQVNDAQYIIDPPDEITITAPNIKEIDKVKAEVRSDGKVALNLLGEVQVAGMTPEQACDRLKTIASKYYFGPDIKIDVVAKSKFYNVFGAGASQPSKKPYTGNDCILKAIAETGFNYQESWPEQVVLARPGKNGAPPTRVIIDFTKIFEDGDLRQNYVLQEGDIIDMRDSPLAHFNRKFEQVIGPLTGTTGAVGSAAAVHPGP